jgi:hypothetical protein
MKATDVQLVARSWQGDIQHPFGQQWGLFNAGTATLMVVHTLSEEVF